MVWWVVWFCGDIGVRSGLPDGFVYRDVKDDTVSSVVIFESQSSRLLFRRYGMWLI